MEEGPHSSAEYLHLDACGVTFACTFIGRGIGLGLRSAVILEKLPSGLASRGFSWPASWKPLSSDPDLSGCCRLTHVLPCPTPSPFETHCHSVWRHCCLRRVGNPVRREGPSRPWDTQMVRAGEEPRVQGKVRQAN